MTTERGRSTVALDDGTEVRVKKLKRWNQFVGIASVCAGILLFAVTLGLYEGLRLALFASGVVLAVIHGQFTKERIRLLRAAAAGTAHRRDVTRRMTVLLICGAVIPLALVGLTARVVAGDGPTCGCGPPEQSACITMKALALAQDLYRVTDKDGNGVIEFAPSLHALNQVGFGDFEDRHAQYEFTILEASQFTWAATATPSGRRPWLIRLFFGNDRRAFFIDEREVLRGRESPDGQRATADDAPIPGEDEIPLSPKKSCRSGRLRGR
ncbi:hypothetical protein ACFL59_14645 [Planctomycetota bacterium]